MFEDLRQRERSQHSQGGEDGVLERIFACIGAGGRRFVEFGAWDGQHLSNTAHLRLAHGWSGLLMDGDPDRVAEGLVHCETVTAENIHTLFAKYDVPRVFDLLSLDIDGNEYWIWRALTDYVPRVVVVEYNICFATDVSVTTPYDPAFRWDKTTYHGASLAALRKLGREKGYSLVHTDGFAPNAFFVLDSELPPDAIAPPIDQVASYRFRPGTAPAVPEDREWVSI